MNGGGGWGIFNAILGWQNSATYGSVLSYNLYWIAVIVAFVAMRFNERKGRWPLMKPKQNFVVEGAGGDSSSDTDKAAAEKEFGKTIDEVQPSTSVRKLDV